MTIVQAGCQYRVAIGTRGLMSFCAGLDVKREAHKERKTRRGATLPDRGEERRESGSHRTQGDTNHQSQSLLLYTTPLYLLSILNQSMLFIQIN